MCRHFKALTCDFPCFFQIRVDGIPSASQNALLYETVTVVEGKPILRDMVFSPDHQYIYLLSDRQVHIHTHTHKFERICQNWEICKKKKTSKSVISSLKMKSAVQSWSLPDRNLIMCSDKRQESVQGCVCACLCARVCVCV